MGRAGSIRLRGAQAAIETFGVRVERSQHESSGAETDRLKRPSRRLSSKSRAAIAIAAVCFVYCATSRATSGQSNSNSGSSGGAGLATEHRAARYQLQSEDVLTISFPLSPEFDQTVTIQPDGYISLLGAGDLSVRGLTVPGLVDALQTAYRGVLNQPIINVSLKDFQSPFFVVSGQVTKPGQFTLRYQTTVSEAIAVAGGLTPAGKSRVFLLRRSSAGWFRVTPLNLSDILTGKQVEDALIQPGDMIYVPEKFITKFRTYVPYSLGFYTSPQLAF